MWKNQSCYPQTERFLHFHYRTLVHSKRMPKITLLTFLFLRFSCASPCCLFAFPSTLLSSALSSSFLSFTFSRHSRKCTIIIYYFLPFHRPYRSAAIYVADVIHLATDFGHPPRSSDATTQTTKFRAHIQKKK